MLAEFIELSPTDNSKQGVFYINPVHVVRVAKVLGLDPEKGILAANITDVNGKTIRVEGSPSQTRQTLQNPR